MTSDPVARVRAAQSLAEHAREIRRLGKRAAEDIIEIGRRPIEAKAIAGHGNWLPWLEREFGWKERTAQNFVRVAELAKSANVADLNVDVSALYLLAAPSTPAEVVEEVAARSQEGEKVTRSDVAAMVARVVHVQTTYETHRIIAPVPTSAPAGDVISLGRSSPIEQRLERESAAIKQKLENKVASIGVGAQPEIGGQSGGPPGGFRRTFERRACRERSCG